MAVVTFDDLPLTGALLGLDVGSKRIGVAVSDPHRLIASPLTTIGRGKKRFDVLADEIRALADARACTALIVGLPLNMNGSEGPGAQSVRAFCRHLLDRRNDTILLWDERLSTRAAERARILAGARRARRAGKIDAIAASFMLQGALDRCARRLAPQTEHPYCPPHE